MPESRARPWIWDSKACIGKPYAAKSESRAHQELRCHPLLAPCAVARGHVCDHASDVGRQSGGPRALDFHRQNQRNPLRCQRISVSGFTMTSN